MSLKIAIVTDTHVRPPDDDGQLAFPSDASHNARNKVIVEQVALRKPDLVMHLGDVVHPIPTLPTHAPALAEAKAMFEGFGADLVVVPGNHDVGDKRSSVYAPEQVDAGRKAFAETWGPPFHAFDRDGVRFVVLDGGLLAANTEEALAQRTWLLDVLREGRRTFVFTHYPPFLTDPDEPEHYDNLDPSSRRWLLDLCAEHGVEAVLTGHVHRFFYNRYRGVDIYTVPSTAFVRPAYAWLRPHPAVDAENGRDDTEHTGFSWLEIDEEGHRLQVIRPRTVGASSSPQAPKPLGVWLQHRLGRRAELPMGSLDALTRKVARDDAMLLHIQALGLGRIRIPLADGEDRDVLDRVAWLERHGVEVTVFSGRAPSVADRALRRQAFASAEWEVVLRDATLARLRELTPSDRPWAVEHITLSRIGKPPADGGYFSHFPKQGFELEDPMWRAFAEDPAVTRVAFRIPSTGNVEGRIATCIRAAAKAGVGATCHVELPEAAEATRHTDDEATAAVAAAASRAAKANPGSHILLDGLYDYDRGYWCKNGLIDLTDQPRKAAGAIDLATP
ncbi:MAG: metallophosphoesterase [Myxococcota bacterium]